MTSLRTLALVALAAEQISNNAPDSEANAAIVDAFDKRQNFLSALREITGIDDAMWSILIREGILG